MQNKQNIVPIFSGERFHGEIIEGYHFQSRGQSYIEVREGGAHAVKPETLKMSLGNGTTWATMEEVRDALELLIDRRHEEESRYMDLPPTMGGV